MRDRADGDGSSFERPPAVVARQPTPEALHRHPTLLELLGRGRRADDAFASLEPELAQSLDPLHQDRDTLPELGIPRGRTLTIPAARVNDGESSSGLTVVLVNDGIEEV